MTPLEDERLAHLVRLLERQFRRSLQSKLKQHDVMFGHWEFLRILWEEEGLSQKELANRAGLTGPTTHTAMTKMEQKGFIKRVVPEGGNSRPVIMLSELGHELEGKLVPLALSTNEAAIEGLSEEEVRQARSLLVKLTRNLMDEENRLQEDHGK